MTYASRALIITFFSSLSLPTNSSVCLIIESTLAVVPLKDQLSFVGSWELVEDMVELFIGALII